MGSPKWIADKSTAPAIIVAALLVQALYFRWIPVESLADPLFVCAAIALSLLAGFALRGIVRWAIGVLTRRPPHQRTALLGSFAVAGWLLTWAIPVPPAPQGRIELEIVATGEKAPAAVSSEVWARLELNGEPVPPSEFIHDGQWEVRGEFMLSVPGRQPATLQWSGEPTGDIQLILVSHPWSGYSRISVDNRESLVDLYSPESTAKYLALSERSGGDDRLSYPERTLLQQWVQLCDGVLIGAGLLLAFLYLSSRALADGVRSSSATRWESLHYAVPTWIVGGALLLIFYPGLMTADSLDQWRQAKSGVYNDVHPLLYALMMKANQAVADGPALLAMLQVLAMGASAGWMIAVVRSATGSSHLTAWLGAVLIALHPMVALTNITIWKDVPYTICAIALTAYLARASISRRGTALGLRGAIGLGVAMGGAAVLRHNGPPLAIAVSLLMWMFAPAGRRNIAIAVVIALALVATTRGPMPALLNSTNGNLSYALFVHHLGAHRVAGTSVTDDKEAQLLESLDSADKTWRYNCATINPTIYDSSFNNARASESNKQLLRILLEMNIRAPSVAAAHVMCASSLVWRVTGRDAPLYISGPAIWAPEGRVKWIVSRQGDPVEASLFPSAAQRLGHLILSSSADLIWRPAAYLYLLLFAVAVGASRAGSWRIILVAAPVLVHSLFLVVAAVAQDARYQLPVYIVAIALSPLLLSAESGIAGKRPQANVRS